jgi:hypothetical protein
VNRTEQRLAQRCFVHRPISCCILNPLSLNSVVANQIQRILDDRDDHTVSNLLWDPKINYLHKNPPMNPSLSQFNPVHKFTSYSVHVNVNTSSLYAWFYPVISSLQMRFQVLTATSMRMAVFWVAIFFPLSLPTKPL